MGENQPYASKKNTHYDKLAAHCAGNLGVGRNAIVDAIKTGKCAGECIDGKYYTNNPAALDWYNQHYRHRDKSFAAPTGKTWTDREDALLMGMTNAGMPTKVIAEKLKRTAPSVRVRKSRLKKQGTWDDQMLPQTADPPSGAPDTGQAKRNDRQAHQEGRIQPRIPANIVQIFGDFARKNSISTTQLVSLAVLAAIESPELLTAGEIVLSGIPKNQDRNRLRLHLHPQLKYMLTSAAELHEMTPARVILYATLAATRVPEMLQIGEQAQNKLGF